MLAPTPDSGPTPDLVCHSCFGAIVPEKTAAGVVVQPVIITSKIATSNFHLNCTGTTFFRELKFKVEFDTEIAALGAAYEKTCPNK